MLSKLLQHHKLVCLQEHWLWEYETSLLDQLAPNHESYTIPTPDEYSLAYRRRGHGGIAILWSRDISHLVKKCEKDSDHRIQAVLLNDEVCIINAYLPSGESAQALFDYNEYLDKLITLLVKYSAYNIVFVGDLNASLIREKKKDKILQSFVREANLQNGLLGNSSHTYFHTGANVSSQIYYILTSHSNAVMNTSVLSEDPSNTSTHRPVSGHIPLNPTFQSTPLHKPKPKCSKIRWDTLDKEEMAQQMVSMLPPEIKTAEGYRDSVDVDAATQCIERAVVESALLCSKQKKPKLKGPAKKVNKDTLALIKHRKECLGHWKTAGRPPLPHPLARACAQAKRSVRAAMRTEDARTRHLLYTDLASTDKTSEFHRIISLHRDDALKSATAIMSEDQTLIFDPGEQTEDWAKYFEKLGTPSHPTPDFEDLRYTTTLLELHNTTPIADFEAQEIEYAILSLNHGKAADEYGLQAEHLCAVRTSLAPVLTALFNAIKRLKYVPEHFKTGILTPVGKKAKDHRHKDNHRGISVTALLGKVLETCIKNRRDPTQRLHQNPLQFGFTTEHCPAMASLILMDARVSAEEDGEDLFICTLDARKAFDVVPHKQLLTKVHQEDTEPGLTKLIQESYDGMSSRVKWKDTLSSPFPVQQGTRQGGIMSTGLYKSFLNPLLNCIQSENIGLKIGGIPLSTPTVADDVCLLAKDPGELQVMIDLCHDYSERNQYELHPTKSEVMPLPAGPVSTKGANTNLSWTLGYKEITKVDSITHLGINYHTTHRLTVTNLVTDRISLARRTAYSLLGVGLHGINGLPPPVALRIFNTYVLPRLVYGMETVFLNATQRKEIATYQNRVLRQLMSLPTRAATPCLYILTGTLPIRAVVDSRKLTLIGNICSGVNISLQNLFVYQCAIRSPDSQSWFVQAAQLLAYYDLPSVSELIENSPNKSEWKLVVKKAVRKHWAAIILREAAEKSSLQRLNTESLRFGIHHPLWKTGCNPKDVGRAAVKAQMVTGTYRTFSNQSKFTEGRVPPDCPLCLSGQFETIEHILLDCPSLDIVRKTQFNLLAETIIHGHGIYVWANILSDRNRLLQLILDVTKLGFKAQDVDVIEEQCRRFIYTLHCRRVYLLDQNSPLSQPVPTLPQARLPKQQRSNPHPNQQQSDQPRRRCSSQRRNPINRVENLD